MKQEYNFKKVLEDAIKMTEEEIVKLQGKREAYKETLEYLTQQQIEFTKEVSEEETAAEQVEAN